MRKALVLGAYGNFGSAMCRAFASSHWGVVGQVRQIDTARGADGVDYVACGLDDVETLMQRARGARVVIHAMNTGYAQWDKASIPALRLAVEIAGQLNARLVFPGNTYAYGDPLRALIDEDTAEAATTRKGQIRSEMEALLRDASRARRIRSLIVRSGDFLGGNATGGWFGRVVLGKVVKGVITYPGPLHVIHPWQDVDHFAEIVERLSQTELALPEHASFCSEGMALTGHELCHALAREMSSLPAQFGTHPARIQPMSWLPIHVGKLFSHELREVAELQSMWRQDHQLNGFRLRKFLGRAYPEPKSLDQTLRAALERLFAQRTDTTPAIPQGLQ